MDEKSKEMFDELKKQIDALRKYEGTKSEDMPITLQMESDIYDFSKEERSITFSFPVMKKELNPNGAMMGGVICTALDVLWTACFRIMRRRSYTSYSFNDNKLYKCHIRRRHPSCNGKNRILGKENNKYDSQGSIKGYRKNNSNINSRIYKQR